MHARLSFNTNGWQRPSGSIGKSTNPIHEHIYGFGFEEWIFNKTFTLMDLKGYKWHFGYIEGIHKNYRIGDEQQPLKLFTIDARTKLRYIVAEINEWKKITPEESTILIEQYPNLIEQLEIDIGAIHNQFALGKFHQHVNNENGYQLFNVKFKNFNYLYDINNALPRPHLIYNLHRFWLFR